MSRNYLLRGILAALPSDTPARHLRLLVALETMTPDEEGWRSIGMRLLGEYAGLSQPHLRRARDELETAGHLAVETTGRGPHARVRWRILVDELPPRMNPSSSPDRMNPSSSSEESSNEPPRLSDEPPKPMTSGNPPQCSYSAPDDDAAVVIAQETGWPLEHCRDVAAYMIGHANEPVAQPARFVLACLKGDRVGFYAPGSFNHRPPQRPAGRRSRPTPGVQRCSNGRPIACEEDGSRTCCPEHDAA